MANLTNSGKLIDKIEDIDSKIGNIPAGTDIAQELSDIEDSIGNVPAGSNIMAEVQNAADAAADAATAAAAVASDLADFETEVASTYATKADISSVYKYKGSVANYAALPVSGQSVGDVYNVETADTSHDIKAGDNVAWNGSAWDVLAGTVDLSAYATKQYVDDEIDTVEGTVTTLAGRVTTVEGKVTTLEGQMATANSNISTLQSDVSDIKGDVSDLQTAVEQIITGNPFEGKWVDVVFNNGTQATVNDNFITASTCVDTWVVKTGTAESYAYEYEVAAGILTVKASDTENCTLRMLLIKEISA